MNNQMPKLVLPKIEVMTQSPIMGLAEVRTSFSNTLASIEAALPAGGPGLPGQGGGQAKLGLPKLKQFALSIEEVGPAFMPKLSQMAEQVEKTLAGSEGNETKRGTITEVQPPVGDVATRGSIVVK